MNATDLKNLVASLPHLNEEARREAVMALYYVTRGSIHGLLSVVVGGYCGSETAGLAKEQLETLRDFLTEELGKL